MESSLVNITSLSTKDVNADVVVVRGGSGNRTVNDVVASTPDNNNTRYSGDRKEKEEPDARWGWHGCHHHNLETLSMPTTIASSTKTSTLQARWTSSSVM
ncbi:hypothetical protein Tsubulata_008802 [Turnera subulata]|uniref:Uncharacterized protein n=1 Tax=Turnera subulata TaxID=218843 RepID=A0A9Q0GAK1_9ROSI|nr:hypothetical protein Tsubulata_008802 [Turnera subulata]